MIFSGILPCTCLTLDYFHELPSGMKHPNAVCEAGMSSPRINKFRKSKLLNPPKSLKLSRVQNVP